MKPLKFLSDSIECPENSSESGFLTCAKLAAEFRALWQEKRFSGAPTGKTANETGQDRCEYPACAAARCACESVGTGGDAVDFSVAAVSPYPADGRGRRHQALRDAARPGKGRLTDHRIRVGGHRKIGGQAGRFRARDSRLRRGDGVLPDDRRVRLYGARRR